MRLPHVELSEREYKRDGFNREGHPTQQDFSVPFLQAKQVSRSLFPCADATMLEALDVDLRERRHECLSRSAAESVSSADRPIIGTLTCFQRSLNASF